MPVPTSFLIDRQGMLVAVYRGPVSLTKLKADIEVLEHSHQTSIPQVLPFSGQWHRLPIPRPGGGFQIALDLMKAGAVEDAAWFSKQHAALFGSHGEYSKLMAWAGGELARKGKMTEALSVYQTALNLNPTNILLLNNVAWDLAAHPDPALRDGPAAVVWAEKAARLTNRREITVLDTLATAYAQSGRFPDAIITLKEAIELARGIGQEDRRAKLQKTLDLYEARRNSK